MTKIIAFAIYLWLLGLEIPQPVFDEQPVENEVCVKEAPVPHSVVYMDVSAYTPYDSGTITASGDIPVEGVTVAMNDVPLGTIIEIDGKQYIVQDRCGMDRVDIFMESYDAAIEWGVRHKEIIVYDK